MLKIKKIFLLYLTMLFVALLSVCCVLGVQSVIQASAASPKYTVSLSGTSTHRTWGGSVTDDIENQTKIAVRKNNTSGATEDIILYLTTSSYSGTDVLNNNDYINFAYVKFESSISSNTLKILNSTGGTVASGKGTVSATLSNGQYQVTLNHSKSSGAGYTMWGVDVNVHCYFNVDTTKPTISGGSTSTTGKYTNTAFTVSASDSGSGVEGLYMRTPSSSTYTRVGTSKTVTASSTNGRYYFYAKDKAGNQSSTYYVNLDTGLPTGTIRGASGNLASESYTNKAFSYSATDSQSGISSLQYKKPGSSSWQTYISGTSIPTTSTDGWYYFRALDKAGNYSAESSVYLDTVLPTCSIKRDDVVVSGGNYVQGTYVLFSASDSGSGILSCYVKKPGSSSFLAYTNNSPLTSEGRYEFYAVDKAGNQTVNCSITLDNTVPTGTLYGGTSTKTSGCFVNSSYVKYTASDTNSGILALYVKKPGSSSFTTFTDETTFSAEGKYEFYSADRAGNESTHMTITLDLTKPAGSIYGGSTVLSSGAKTNAAYVKYTATDALSGMSKYYVKKPGAGAFESYTSGAQLTADGLYEFYSVDIAGNESVHMTVTLDKTKPNGQIYAGSNAIQNGSSVNASYVRFTATDALTGVAKLYVMMPGTKEYQAYNSTTQLTAEGKYSFYAEDVVGNRSDTYTVTLDRTSPAGNLYAGGDAVTDGEITNAADITFKATDNIGVAGLYVKKPNADSAEVFTSETMFTVEGEYEFYAVDGAGNKSPTFRILLDKTKPTIEVKGGETVLSGGAKTNAAFLKMTAHDGLSGVDKLFVKLPGDNGFVEYTDSAQLTAEGEYSFYATDMAGNNSGTVTVLLDRTKPIGHIYAGEKEAQSGTFTNAEYVKYSATDSLSGLAEMYVKKPGDSKAAVFSSGTVFTKEGLYEFYSVDQAGNKSDTIRITLDKTNPALTLYAGNAQVSAGAKTNAAFIRMQASDGLSGIAKLFVKLPGAGEFTEYVGGTQLTAEGEYSFYCVDHAGNQSATVAITLDRTKPVGTLYAGTAEKSSGTFTNASYIKYTASDAGAGIAGLYVKKPGGSKFESYTSGTQLSAEGRYEFYSRDLAGNQSDAVTITLDRTLPTGTLYGGTAVKSSGAYTNAEYVKYIAADSLSGVANCYVKVPGGSAYTNYTSGAELTAEGEYSFYCTDRSGNKSATVTIVLDKTKPVGILYAGETAKGSGTFTNAEYVKYAASDSGSGVAGLYVKKPGDSEFESYTSDTQLTAEGAYSFYAVDRAGNQSETVTITLDKTNPTGTLYGEESSVNSGDATNAAYIKFIAQDETALSGVFVKLPGGEEFVNYTSGTELTDEGTYEFYVTDKAGNTSETYTVILDRKIPAAQLYVDGEAFGNNGYTNGEHIRFECAEACYVKQPGSETFEAYLPGTEFYKPGKYVFYGESEAGNSTGYFTITIDRTQKPLEVSGVTGGKTDGDVILTWTDGNPEQFAPVVSVTVNGKAYTNGATIYTIDTGVYEVICTDAAGNVWTTEFASSKQNVLTETLQKEYWEASNAEGEFFAFATYDAAFAFATQRENTLVRTGEWNSEIWDAGIAMDAKDSVNAANGTYFIYKKSGNPEELVAYFTEERLNEVIAEYAKIGIESYYYWEKAPASISDGENLYSYSDGKTILADAVQLGGNIGCLMDGETFVGTVVETEGRHVLTVLDDWGNTCEYNLIIIRTAPEILYAAGEGNANAVTFDRTYYFKDAVTISIADAFDEMAMFNVYGEDGSLIGSYSLGETYTIEGSGVYTVEAVNHFGKSQVFSLIISRNAPEIEMTENTEDKTLDITISESPDAQSHIQTIEIYKSADGGETWVLLTADDYGTAISVENLAYRFRTSGLYRVVVTDEFRTGIDAVTESLSYTQAAPDGVLKGVENGGYTNGTVTFEWKDEARVTVKKDGKVIEYTSGKKLTEDGKYEITFENFDGYKTTYTFIIDTAAPEIVLSGAKDGGTVNGDVSATFEGEGVTAELFKDGKSLGAYVSGTVIAVDGAYKIVVTDLAQNKTEVEFSIDKTAGYAINVNDKGLSNSVTVTANEEVTLVLTKNGETVEYKLGDAITAPAAYTLTITDALGNKAEVSFTIVEPLVQKFEHNFDETPGFEKALVNGEEKRLNYGTLELFEDGTYEVGIVVSGKTYTFTVTVDGTAPTLKLDGVENGGTTKGGVILSELTESATVEVYRDGEKIEYTPGSELTEVGQYRVVVTDEIGNSSEYTFAIEYSMNGGIIALIVIAAIAVVALVVVFIIRQKKKSEKAEETTEESQN